MIGRRWHRRDMPDLEVVVMALLTIAIIRSIASIWLPHIGNGLTRQHRTSIVVGVMAVTAGVVIRRRQQRPMISGDA